MLIEGSKTVPRPRAEVWQALHDPQFLQRVIPGCTAVRAVGDSGLEVRLTAALGPVRTGFDMQLEVAEIAALHAYELRGKGSAGPAGSATGSVRVDLADIEGGTALRYSAQTELSGRIAQLGSRMIDAAARRFSEEFFLNVHHALDGAAALPQGAAAPAVRARDVAAAPQELLAAFAQLHWRLFAACFGGTFTGALAAWLVLH
jgi:carbon monoxide dehydrogenase subunit G